MRTRTNNSSQTPRAEPCVHSLRHLLRSHHVGLRPDFNLAQTIDRESVLDEAIEAGANTIPASPIGESDWPMRNGLLDNCVSADPLGELNKRRVGAEILATIYANYRRLMIENNQWILGD